MGEHHETLSFVPRLTGLFFQRLVYIPLQRSGAPHSLRKPQGCGFPHTQAAKRTAPSDSAAFDKLRPRASRGELVAGRRSLKKGFHGLAGQEGSRQKSHPLLDQLPGRISSISEIAFYRP